jgi:hypothetical protein
MGDNRDKISKSADLTVKGAEKTLYSKRDESRHMSADATPVSILDQIMDGCSPPDRP